MLIRFAATVGGLTMVSRILGFARDILIAGFLGASSAGDAFFIAFKFPNLFRRLFSEGAFSLAFVPLFARQLEINGRSSARFFAEEVLAILIWVLLLIVILAQIFMPWLMLLIAPGFSSDADKFDLTVYLARLTFPYLLYIEQSGAICSCRSSAYFSEPLFDSLFASRYEIVGASDPLSFMGCCFGRGNPISLARLEL